MPSWRWWAAACGGLSLVYVAVFVLAARAGPTAPQLLAAVSNAVPHVVLAIPLVERVAPGLERAPRARAVATGVCAALLYASAAYGATIFLLALTSQVRAEGIWVQFFQGAALPWQMFQSLTYAALALTLGLLLSAHRRLGAAPAPAARAPIRWLVRTADGIEPVDPAEIVRIEAEGECSRLVLERRTILARIGLGDCAARLAADPFLRVHRSHLINGDAVVRAESAGNGRLQLTLRNGDQVITSRDGARLVRRSVV